MTVFMLPQKEKGKPKQHATSVLRWCCYISVFSCRATGPHGASDQPTVAHNSLSHPLFELLSLPDCYTHQHLTTAHITLPYRRRYPCKMWNGFSDLVRVGVSRRPLLLRGSSPLHLCKWFGRLGHCAPQRQTLALLFFCCNNRITHGCHHGSPPVSVTCEGLQSAPPMYCKHFSSWILTCEWSQWMAARLCCFSVV